MRDAGHGTLTQGFFTKVSRISPASRVGPATSCTANTLARALYSPTIQQTPFGFWLKSNIFITQ